MGQLFQLPPVFCSVITMHIKKMIKVLFGEYWISRMFDEINNWNSEGLLLITSGRANIVCRDEIGGFVPYVNDGGIKKMCLGTMPFGFQFLCLMEGNSRRKGYTGP